MLDALSERLMNSAEPLKVHLVGVAGSGMSGLAGLLLGMGHKVSGCDRVTSDETERLQKEGMTFYSPHTKDCVAGIDLLVYSSAIRANNPAREAATEQAVPQILRAELLAAILHTRDGVVVSGTHGKTTTSAMCAHVLRKTNQNPCHYVGAEIPVLGTNAHWNPEGELMVAEGDESDGTLTLYKPKHLIVLNVEAEHLDHYSGIDEIKEVFSTVVSQTSGSVIYCGDDEHAADVCAKHPGAVSYGFGESDFQAVDVVERSGRVLFDVVRRGENIGRVELGIPGRHNVLNALAAIALADGEGVDFDDYSRPLATFAGARRRFETKYLSKNFRVIDDYGHHPTEIRATLETVKCLKPERIVVYFQPHRYSRTERLAKEFGEALAMADVVYVSQVYAASEDPIPGVTGQTIVDEVLKHPDVKCFFEPELETAHYKIGNSLKPGDVFLTLGAGNVHETGTKIVRDLGVLDDLLSESGEENICLYEPMRKHTTMLVGGPAQFWVEPETFTGFAKAVNHLKDRGIAVRIVGRGSNLLVKDGGIRGAVVHPKGGEFKEVTVEGDRITAGVGARFKKIASVAQKAGIGGFEWMEGIPGNVGGGLRMNAGAMGIETFDQVVDVTFLDEDGEIRTRSREEITFNYRSVPELRRNYALKATFVGAPAKEEAISEKMDESRLKRLSSQPRAASAGCIFKNPEGIGAGQLIDEMGLKGLTVGKAQVSEVHANFMTNTGGASAREVQALIDQVTRTAKKERGIRLETEVQILGEDEFTF